MATTTWARTEEANIGLLNEKLKREMYNKTFWARFAGFTKISGEGKDQVAMPSGQPIEIMRDFVKQGMDHMLVPLLRNLTGAGIMGDKQLEGNEEQLDIYYNKVYINQIRNGVKLGGRMSQQRLKTLRIERERQPLLSDWLANWNEIQLARTFLEGWDAHITATTVNGGIYINSGQKRCHPNFFTAGSGKSTYSATDATYEGTLDDDLSNLTDTASDYMSVDLIEAMRVEVQKLKIQPIEVEGGYQFWPWLLHANQARQLRADSDWKASQREVGPRDMSNPIFRGSLGAYGGFVFYERLLGVFGANPAGTSTTVTFGATNPLTGMDTYARKCSIIFGKGAIARGVAADPFFEREGYDYNNVTGIGVGQIVGDARGEFNDSTSSPTAIINETSCVVATYSDNAFA